MNVIKRTGKEVKFNLSKIVNAITLATQSCETAELNESQIKDIAKEIETYAKTLKRSLDIEEIQERVESALIDASAGETAKNYIRYRYQKTLDRNNNDLYGTILSIVDNSNEEVKQENANKNPSVASTQRDYIAGAVSKDIVMNRLLPEDIVRAHNEGVIHFHDADYFIQHIHNCCLINLEDILQNGTVISGTLIEKPKSFSTACNIASQVVASVASMQFGGQSITLSHLAPFVQVSREKYYRELIEESNRLKIVMSSEQMHDFVEHKIQEEIKRGVQTLAYQIITLSTSNGQTPFITVFMCLSEAKNEQEKKDLARIFEEVLKQRIEGVKNEKGVWISPAFPKLIYSLSEENIHEDSPYYYLTELAAQCSAKRLVPDYISEKKMLELKGDVYPSMGSVSGQEVIHYRIGQDYFTESIERAWERLGSYADEKLQSNNVDKYRDLEDVYIYDHVLGDYTPMHRIIQNHVYEDWIELTLSNGRIIKTTPDHLFETSEGEKLARDLNMSERISINTKRVVNDCDTKPTDPEPAWTPGYDLMDSIGNYIPSEVFTWSRDARLSFVAGVVDSIGTLLEPVSGSDGLRAIKVNSLDRERILQFALLVQDLDMPARVYRREGGLYQYSAEFYPCKELMECIASENKRYNVPQEAYDRIQRQLSEVEDSAVIKKEYIPYSRDEFSYDASTGSVHFTVSGIYSHNCRSFLTPDRFTDVGLGNIARAKNDTGQHKYYGRFNQGVVTINLVDVACTAKETLGDPTKFWDVLDERLELCHKALRIRHERLLGTPAITAPILWQHGALARLDADDTIDSLLYHGYSTISLGYAGLWECVYELTGFKLTEEEGEKMGLRIMQHLNDACDKWKREEDIDYSVYGSPIESTTYKFAKCLQRRFGVIEGVSDKSYITNSYHVKVTEPIDAFSKLALEGKFQALSPGGAISYVEIPNMQHNIEAVLDVVKFIYDNITYAELNTKSDYCQCCGYSGEISIVEDENKKLIWKCPNCGNVDREKMNITRRVCGYLSVNDFNQGRTQEIKERVLHL